MKIKQELSSIELKYNQNHNREENTDRVTDRIDRKINLINYLIDRLPKHSLLKQSLLSLSSEDTERLTLGYLRDKVKELLIRKQKRLQNTNTIPV